MGQSNSKNKGKQQAGHSQDNDYHKQQQDIRHESDGSYYEGSDDDHSHQPPTEVRNPTTHDEMNDSQLSPTQFLAKRKVKTIKAEVKPRPQGDYQFSFLSDSFCTEDTLLDALVYLLSSNEKIGELAEDPEVIEFVNQTEVSKIFQEFLATTHKIRTLGSASISEIKQIMNRKRSVSKHNIIKDFLGSLSVGMKIPLLDEACSDITCTDTFAEMVTAFKDAYLSDSHQVNLEDKKVCNLLVALLFKDLYPKGKSASLLTDLKATTTKQIAAVYSEQGDGQFKTLLAKQLIRLIHSQAPEDLEMDDLSDDLCSKFKMLLDNRLKSSKNDFETLRHIGQSCYSHSLDSNYTLFDLTPSFNIGFFNIKMQFTCNQSRRNLLYYLPSGKNFKIKKLAILSSVEIPKLTEEEEAGFKYPTVLDSVAKLEAKEKFAVSDYDWIQLSYNISDACFNWLAGHQSNHRGFESQTNTNLYFSYNNQFANLKKCLLIPLSDVRDLTNWNVARRCSFDLFVTDDVGSTVGDLLKFIEKRLAVNGLKDIALRHSDLEFRLLNARNLKNSIIPATASENLLEIITKLDANAKAKSESTSQTISYICSFSNKKLRKETVQSTQNISVNLSKEEIIKMNSFNNNDMLKSTLTSFFDFFLGLAFKDNYLRILSQHYYGGQNASYWLPNIMIIDVSRISAHLVDPKKDVELVQLATAVKEMQLLATNKYSVRGFICSAVKQATGQEYYYPVTVKSARSPCIGQRENMVVSSLNDIDDSAVKFVILNRLEKD